MKTSFKPYWNLLVTYLRPQGPRVLLLAVLLFGNIGLQLVNPLIIRRFIDTAYSGEGTETLFRLALLFMGIALVQQLVSVLATYASESVGWTATNALRADLAEHCLRLDMSFHNARTPGEMIERLDGDVTALSNFFSRFVVQVCGNAILLVGVLILLFREDWRVGSALGVFALITLLALLKLRNIAIPHWVASRQASATLFGFLGESLSGTEDVRSCGAKAYVMRRFYQLAWTLMKKTRKAALMVNIITNTTFVLIALGNAIAFVVGAWLFRSGVFTIGTVFIIFWYSNLLVEPIQRITGQLQDLQRAGAGIERIQELLGVQSKIQPVAVVPDGKSPLPSDSVLPRGALAVAFQDVSFAYDTSPSSAQGTSSAEGILPLGERSASENGIVLQDLCFELQPGTVLGLLGRTGSGKTTLTRLLFRLYDLDKGKISLAGDGTLLTDIRQVPLADLRRRVGIVTQDVQLFHATLRDNLTFFDRSIPDEEILKVIQELGLWEWYQSRSEGLDTKLASGDGGVSAGEAQLLAFGRIFLKDPGLVILDEASSRLDPATEHLIERAVDRLLEGRTAIIIAHRLKTIQRVDEIMILEKGRVREYGTRSRLANDPSSHFYHLLQTGLEEILT